jgi:hypothetical protein
LGILKMVDATEVTDASKFARYAQQELGTPVPGNTKQRIALAAVAKKAFEENPSLSWPVMVKVVDYCKNRKRRPYSAMAIFGEVRFAWSAGYLPELDPKQVESRDPRIEQALLVEETCGKQDREWVRKLTTTTGAMSTKVYLAWKAERLVEI